MAFDTPCPFPLHTGSYLTRDGGRAEIFALRINYEGRRIAIGCTYTAAGDVRFTCDWDAATGLSRMHGGVCRDDIIAMAIG
jgi:hypothetical protein